MNTNGKSQISVLLMKDESQLLADWLKEQTASGPEEERINGAERREQSQEFLRLLRDAAQNAAVADETLPEWQRVREMLAGVSSSRARQGFSPSETATFVFSLKKPLFDRLRRELGKDAEALAEETWNATRLLDQLGLWTTEVFQTARDEVIARQQEEMLELSTDRKSTRLNSSHI